MACINVLPVVVWEALPLTPLLGGCDISCRAADLPDERLLPPLPDVFCEAFLPPSSAIVVVFVCCCWAAAAAKSQLSGYMLLLGLPVGLLSAGRMCGR